MAFSMPPGLRIPYDTDGTIGLIHPAQTIGGILEIHHNAMLALNSTTGGGMFVSTTQWPISVDARPDIGNTYPWDLSLAPFFGLVFPVPMRIRGIFFSASRGYANTGTPSDPEKNLTDRTWVETSRDSTNLLDGNWTYLDTLVRGRVPFVGTSVEGRDVVTGAAASTIDGGRQLRGITTVYRKLMSEEGVGIEAFSGAVVRNVKALRVYPLEQGTELIGRANGQFFMHLYGEPDTDAYGLNYLQGWRSESDMRLGGASLSWGDVPLASSADKSFRIKNMSDTDTANNIVVSAEDLIFYPSNVAGQLLFSLNGTTWTPTVTIGAIGPGTISSDIMIRKVTPSNAPLGSWSPRIKFTVGGWS